MNREMVKKFMKISSIMVLFILVISLVTQAMLLVDINVTENSLTNYEPNVHLAEDLHLCGRMNF
jgi:hypothetical protein